MLAKVDDPDLAAYVVWVPRNGALERHVDRVTTLTNDSRALHYWDGLQTVMAPYNDMFSLTGPCAGVFLVFGPKARWDGEAPPRPDYAEDAHAKQFDRPLPQWDAKRFAERVLEMIP